MNRLKSSLPSFSKSTATPDEEPTAAEERLTADPLTPDQVALISQRRQITQSLYATFASYHKTLSKVRTDPQSDSTINLGALKRGGNETKLPTRWFALSLLDAAELTKDTDTAYSELSSLLDAVARFLTR